MARSKATEEYLKVLSFAPSSLACGLIERSGRTKQDFPTHDSTSATSTIGTSDVAKIKKDANFAKYEEESNHNRPPWRA